MSSKKIIESNRKELEEIRLKLSELEVDSAEQGASDEVHQWRQKFDTSKSTQMEQVLNKMEKNIQKKIKQLANELGDSLNEFKETNFALLSELDAFISKINPDDEIQLRYVKSELDSINKKIDSLQIDILVQSVDKSQQRRTSIPVMYNMPTVVKVFRCEDSPTTTKSATNFFDPLTRFVRRASSFTGNFYNIDPIVQDNNASRK
ncbi:hypothetical protein I4U23_029935 [Adineta vaga]|nr:hypothetical protein I4U23_029935 [Adineta vaga]